MTRSTGTMSPVLQRIVFCVLAAMMFLEVGCVSRRLYERVQAETVEHNQALEVVRGDVRELDQEIAGLQASNRREDAAMSELRTTIQQEEEQLPIMRQRAEDALALLKTQVATLMSQSWQLARKIVDIRQESVSLQAKVAHYKEEIEQVRTPVMVASERHEPETIEAVVSQVPPPSITPTQDTELTQVAEAAPPPTLSPAQPAAPVSTVNIDPPQTNDSWIDMILGWFSAFWKWLMS